MKNKFLKRFASMLLIVCMLMTACLPAAALSIQGATDPETNLPSMTLTYEDGVLSLRVNAELLYQVLSDRKLTKEEIAQFLPEDVYALFEDGKTPSADELREVLLSYLTADELKAMVADLPKELIKNLIDLDTILNLFEIDQMMKLVDIKTLLEGVPSEDMLKLVEGKPLEMMMTEKVMTTAIENIDKEALKKLLTDKEITGDSAVSAEMEKQFEALMAEGNPKRDELLNDILDDKNKEIFNQLLTDAVRSSLLEQALTSLTDEKMQEMEKDGLISFDNLTSDNIKALMDAGVVVISPDDITIEKVVDKVAGKEDKLLAYLTPAGENAYSKNELASVFFERDYFSYDKIKDAVNFSDEVVDKLKALLESKGFLDDEIKALFGTALDNDALMKKLFDLIVTDEKNRITLADLEECGAVNTTPEILKDLMGQLSPDEISTHFYGENKEQILRKLLIEDGAPLSFSDLQACGAVEVEAIGGVKALLESKLDDDSILLSDEVKGRLQGYLLEYESSQNGETLLQSLFEDAELFTTGILSLEELKASGAIDTSNDTLQALTSYLTAAQVEEHFYGENKEEILKSLLSGENPALTLEDFEDCGAINKNDDAIGKVEALLRDKLTSAELNEYFASDWDTDKVQSLLNDDRLSLADLLDPELGLIDPEKVGVNTVLSWIEKGDLLSYIQDIKDDEKYNWTDVAYDFYDMGCISTLQDAKDLGAEIVPSALTWGVVESTGLLTEDMGVIRDCIKSGKYVTTAQIGSALFSEAAKENTLSVIAENIEVFKNYIDLSAFAHAIDPTVLVSKIGLDPIIDALGGYGALFDTSEKGYYSQEDLTAIFREIGTDKIQDFVMTSGILEKLDLPKLISDMIDMLKENKAALGELKDKLSKNVVAMFTQDISEISLNDEVIYYTEQEDTVTCPECGHEDDYEEFPFVDGLLSCPVCDATFAESEGLGVAEFDLTQILTILLQGLPDIEEFCDLEANEDIVSYSIRLLLNREKYPNTRTDGYTYGFSIGFIGDPSELQSLVEDQKDVFALDVKDGLDVTVSSELPATVSVVYKKLLDRLAARAEENANYDELLSLVLSLPTMNLNDAADELTELSDDKVSAVADLLLEKSEALRDELEAALERAGVIGDKIGPRVEQILDQVTTADGLRSLLDAFANKLRSLPGADEKTLDDFYKDDKFTFTEERRIELYDKISRFVTLPEDIRVLFADNMAIYGKLTLHLSAENLHRVRTVTLSQASTFSLRRSAPLELLTSTYYLPEGMNLGVLGLGNLVDANGNLVETVTADASTLYSEEVVDNMRTVTYHFADGYEDVVKNYILGVNDHELALPDIPAELTSKYVCSWPYTEEQILETLQTESTLLVALEMRDPVLTFKGYSTQSGILLTHHWVEFHPEENPSFETFTVADGYLDRYYFDVSLDRFYTWALVDNQEPPDLTVAKDYTILLDITPVRYTVVLVDENDTPLTFDGVANSFVYTPANDAWDAWQGTLPNDQLARDGHTYAIERPDSQMTRDATTLYVPVIYTQIHNRIDFEKTTVEGSLDFSASLWLAPGAGLDDTAIGALFGDDTYYDYVFYRDAGATSLIGDVDALNDYLATFATVQDESIEIYVKKTYKEFTLTFYDENSVLIADKDIVFNPKNEDSHLMPAEIEAHLARTGYEVSFRDENGDPIVWDDIWNTASDCAITVVYTPIEYTATFIVYDEDGVTELFREEVTYLNGASALDDEPEYEYTDADGNPLGYYADWDNYTLSGNITVVGVKTPITYKAYFWDQNGNYILTADRERYYETFTVEDTDKVWEMAVPAKTGYTGEWVYTIQPQDIIVAPYYTPVTYTVTLRYEDGGEVLYETTFSYQHGGSTGIGNYEYSPKRGYYVEWDVPYNTDAVVVRGPESLMAYWYEATFVALTADGPREMGTKYFTVEGWVYSDELPEIPPYDPALTAYYKAPYWKYTLPTPDNDVPLEDMRIYAAYERSHYKVTFVSAGADPDAPILGEVWYQPDTAPDLSALNLDRLGYTTVFDPALDWSRTEDHTVTVSYRKTFYTVTFKYGVSVVGQVTYAHGQTAITAPTPPTRRGYTVAWEPYTLNNADMIVNAVETPISYVIGFMVDGEVIETQSFTVETQSIEEPSVPERIGYRGKWSAYELPYYHTDEPTNLYVVAQYEAIVYTATFVADGKVIGTVEFTVEDSKLSEPDVPVKDGYEGKWGAYTIGASDMTIEAEYTPVKDGSDDEKGSKMWILWLILAILCLAGIGILIYFLLIKKNDDDDTPPPTAPVVAPEPEPVAEEPVAVEEPVEIEKPITPAPAVETAAFAPIYVRSNAQRVIINLGALEANFEAGETVTLDALKAKGLASAKDKRLKVLATGTLTKALTVEADDFSGSAKACIEAVGGKAVWKH